MGLSCIVCLRAFIQLSQFHPVRIPIYSEWMMRVETVTTKAANVRKYPNTNALIYGNLMRGETWNTTSPTTNSWFYGTAGLETAFYEEYGDMAAYVASSNFE